MKRFTLLALVFALVLSTFGFATPAAAAPEAGRKAKVYVIHGIPGQDLGLDAALPVDILVNDAICLLKGFEFGKIKGPVSLDGGTYNFKISPANADAPCSNAAVITADVPFTAGENATVIAHLTEAGAPTASKFINDVSEGARMRARLTVRHTAAAPAVDLGVAIPVGDLTLGTKIAGLANPEQVGPVNIFPYTYEVTLYPAGSDTAVFGPVSLRLRSRTAYFVYAVGSLANNTFTLITHTISIRK
jgi:hypothetical protein